VVLRTTNGAAESMNAMTKQGKRMKTMARGNRNRDRLRNAILFHLGELDLYQRVTSARTDS
jgi:transposase